MDFLDTLNGPQREAVTYQATGALQVLAGPGSGKTKTLTARVAHLIKVDGIPARNVIVITFANKAANEMKHRLKALLGEAILSDLLIGTFHSACVRLLRRHGRLIDIKTNFVIMDQADALSIIKACLQANESEFKALQVDVPKPHTVQEMISFAKAKNWSAEVYRNISQRKDNNSGNLGVAVSYVYEDYMNQLRTDNALDFDDLLNRGLELVTKHPYTVSHIQHVCVDEFQDTNHCQYMLVRKLAAACKAITIVGDPDQSIYGWRSAEVENLDLMMDDFAGCRQIFLEENYRSTGAILRAAVAVVSQDKKRIEKTLFTSQPKGLSVVLRQSPSAPLECVYVAQEIKRMIAHSGGLLDHSDFAILLRYNALSRLFESTFQTERIPNKILGGTKFFDRVEVKDILAYLQLVENPSYSPAFERAINVPKRSIGAATIALIRKAAVDQDKPLMDVLIKAIKSGSTDVLKSAQKKSLSPFVKVIADLRQAANNGASVPQLISQVVNVIEYELYLDRYHSVDKNARLENIEELKAFAAQVAKDSQAVRPGQDEDASLDMQVTLVDIDAEDKKPKVAKADDADYQDEDEDKTKVEEVDSDDLDGVALKPMKKETVDGEEVLNPLQAFLAASMLSTDTVVYDDANKQSKVTISTVHSAKGLEWPVVFVPCVEEGIFPFFRCTAEHEIEEERRLLYVAMTRAQVQLYVTYSSARMRGSQTEPTTLSKFISPIAQPKQENFVYQADVVTAQDRLHMAEFLRRPKIDEEETAKIIAAHSASLPMTPANTYSQIAPNTSLSRFGNSNGSYSQSFSQQQRGGNFGYRAYSASQPLPRLPSASQPVMSGFKSASAAYAQSLSQSQSQSQPAATKGYSASLPSVTITPQLQRAANDTRLSQQAATISAANAHKTSLASFQANANDSLAALRSLGPDTEMPAISTSAEIAEEVSKPAVKQTSVGKGKAKAAPKTIKRRAPAAASESVEAKRSRKK